jgi:hypothetical protein
MTKYPHTTQIDQYVRLKGDGQDQLYMAACAGSPGWVRKHDHDKIGWPMVFIEWDKEHWSYNGEEDRWAFEAHFEPVEDKMSTEDQPPKLPEGMTPEDLMSAFAEFVKTHGQQDTPPAPSTPEPVIDEAAVARKEYQQLLELAYEQMKTADSFLVIFVDRQQSDESPVPLLTPRVANYYLSPEGGFLLGAHLSKLAAMAHDEAAMISIRKVLDGDDSE